RGEGVTAGAGGDQRVRGAPADPQVAQAQVAEERNDRFVRRVEQVATDAGITRSERPAFEAQPGEISRYLRPRMLGVNSDRYRMGDPRGGTLRRGGHHPHLVPGGQEDRPEQDISITSR